MLTIPLFNVRISNQSSTVINDLEYQRKDEDDDFHSLDDITNAGDQGIRNWENLHGRRVSSK